MTRRLDSLRFKVAATLVVGAAAFALCAALAHRAISYQRGVRGAIIYQAGDPIRAYPYLVNASRAALLGRLNATPLIDLGEVAAWAMEDPRIASLDEGMTPAAAARLAFVCYSEGLRRSPTSTRAVAGMADLFRRVRLLRIREIVPTLDDLVAPSGAGGAPDPDPEDALVEAAYRKAIEMEPGNYFWYAYLADYFQERGRRADALPLYGTAIELMPDLGWHYYLGPSGPLPDDMFQVALDALRRALVTNVVYRPERIESSIGYLYERQRDYDNALKHYRLAIERSTDPSQYLYQAAIAFSFQGRMDDALEYYRRALSRGTLSRRQALACLRGMGRIAQGRNDPRAASEHLLQARQIDPSSYEVRVDLAAALRDAGDPGRAEAEARQAIALDATRPEAYTLLVGMHTGEGDFARAIPLARKLVELFPDDERFRAQLDELYRRMDGQPQ